MFQLCLLVETAVGRSSGSQSVFPDPMLDSTVPSVSVGWGVLGRGSGTSLFLRAAGRSLSDRLLESKEITSARPKSTSTPRRRSISYKKFLGPLARFECLALLSYVGLISRCMIPCLCTAARASNRDLKYTLISGTAMLR